MIYNTFLPCEIDSPEEDVVDEGEGIVVVVPVKYIHDISDVVLGEQSVVEILTLQTLLQLFGSQSVVLVSIASFEGSDEQFVKHLPLSSTYRVVPVHVCRVENVLYFS